MVNLSSSRTDLKKNNSQLKWKCLKQKFTFYHVQVINIEVRFTLRFPQVSQQQQQHLLFKHGGF